MHNETCDQNVKLQDGLCLSMYTWLGLSLGTFLSHVNKVRQRTHNIDAHRLKTNMPTASIMKPGCVHSSKPSQEITQLSKILKSICYMTLRNLLSNLLQQAEANTNYVLHGKHVLSTANLIC